jgi:FMN hydrolase / 5-amino-6-(5-phospho-D-ribitylamino)uracil phosphatase
MKSNHQHSIRALFFDLDDTLWPITPVIVQAEQVLFAWLAAHAPHVAASYSIDMMRQQRIQLMQARPELAIDLQALRYQALLDTFIRCDEDPALVTAAMQVFNQARNQVQLFDDVAHCLPHLAKLVKLGSLTNGAADLEAIGLAHHFEVSLSAHKIGKAKPDPHVFLLACEALKLHPEQVAYIGDDLRLDVEGAQKAGLTGIWLNRQHQQAPTELGHIQPDATFTNLHDLVGWLTT